MKYADAHTMEAKIAVGLQHYWMQDKTPLFPPIYT